MSSDDDTKKIVASFALGEVCDRAFADECQRLRVRFEDCMKADSPIYAMYLLSKLGRARFQ